MSKHFILLPVALLLSLCASAQLNIMTYNIRYDNAGDSINSWGNRKEKMQSLLNKYSPDIIGFQEALNNQVDDLAKFLPGYGHTGVGRDDGKTKGEYSPIFYNRKKFKLVSGRTFWLSPTPDKPGSVGWDAALTRICTYAELKEKNSGKIFFVFNTHFDHSGDTARYESAKLILKKIRILAKNQPVIVTGDFNSLPTSEGYIEIISSTNPMLTDAFTEIDSTVTGCTFRGFKVAENICKRIDFIFITPHFVKEKCSIHDDNDGRYYVSDHLPVSAILNWK